MSSGPITPREARSWAWISAAVSGPIARWSWCGTGSRSSRSSRPSGTASSTTPGTGSSPLSSSRRGSGASRPSLVYDKAGIGRSFGSYLASHGFEGAVGYFGAGKGGKLYVNRRTANAFALKRGSIPIARTMCPSTAAASPSGRVLRQELAELRSPTMEIEEGQVKQVLEDKEALAARLHRSPDLLDALLMTFTYSDQG